MAGTSSNYQQFGADPYLLPSQQDLLVAALSSQAPGSNMYENESRGDKFRGKEGSEKQRPSSTQQDYSTETGSSAILAQPDFINSDALAALNADDPSFVDWLNTNDDLSYEAIDNGQAWADEQDGHQSGLPPVINPEGIQISMINEKISVMGQMMEKKMGINDARAKKRWRRNPAVSL